MTTITRQAVAAVLTQARQNAAADTSWINAINKSAVELEAQRWQFDGQTLIIGSRTERGTKHTTDGHVCTCKAFNQETPKPCWHRAAHRLLTRAAQLVQRATAPAPAQRVYPSYRVHTADINATLFA